ncbi:hypothetical protein C8F04DRAFT_1255941 [Mycena alexandri]|uniref:Zn(2)-C6 fungal-type domain-containing protein n=1 Tax=Mycena alexandri TaxID=1745969 RepID=A0AAD6T357_9AGAR|nr:hypothetical protein C8F04DRAFT_1255941 [Mycena alexandri]
MDLYYPAPKKHFPHWAALDDYKYDPPAPRITLAGSLDPTTGIFYRTPEHPRLRTAQACEKCRTRKAKCSGDHPACARCVARGLQCEYAKEGRVRGPNKPKSRANSTASSHPSPLSRTPAPLPPYGDDSLVNINIKRRRRATTMSSGGGVVKLEPLSSCLPLALPSSSSHHGGLDLPLAASKRFSLPASLSNSSSIPSSSSLHPLPLHTLSSAYDYHGAGYAESSTYADSAYTDSRRGSFDPSFASHPYLGHAPDVKVEGYEDAGYGHEAGVYYEPPSAPFHLEAGYAVDTPEHDFAVAMRTHGLDLAVSADGRSTSASSTRSARSHSASSGSSGPTSAVSGSYPLLRATYSPPRTQSHAYSSPHQMSSPAHSHYQTPPPPHSASAIGFVHSGSNYHSPTSHAGSSPMQRSPYASRPQSAYGEQGGGYPQDGGHYYQSAVYGGQPEQTAYADEEYEQLPYDPHGRYAQQHPAYVQEQQPYSSGGGYGSQRSVYDDAMDVDSAGVGASGTIRRTSALRGWVEPPSMPLTSSSSSSTAALGQTGIQHPHPQLSLRIPSVPTLSSVHSTSGYPSSTQRSLTLATEPLSPLSASGSMSGIPLSAASSSSSLAGLPTSASMGLVRTMSETGTRVMANPTSPSVNEAAMGAVTRTRARAATVSGFGGL